MLPSITIGPTGRSIASFPSRPNWSTSDMPVIVILGSTLAALALKTATRTIPIVFQIGPDPVAVGLVASLNRPGGNLTGASIINVEVIAKRLEVLHELVPTAKSVALLVNPTNAAVTEAETKEMQRAAQVLGLSFVVLDATTRPRSRQPLRPHFRKKQAS